MTSFWYFLVTLLVVCLWCTLSRHLLSSRHWHARIPGILLAAPLALIALNWLKLFCLQAVSAFWLASSAPPPGPPPTAFTAGTFWGFGFGVGLFLLQRLIRRNQRKAAAYKDERRRFEDKLCCALDASDSIIHPRQLL